MSDALFRTDDELLVAEELARATAQHGPMHSGHEAQSVIAEEFHEFTLAVWFGVDQHGRPADPRAEAIQLAAMCLRYLRDVPAPAAVREPEEPAPASSCAGSRRRGTQMTQPERIRLPFDRAGRAPDITPTVPEGGYIWRIDTEKIQPTKPDWSAGIGLWIISGPFHPMWSWWYASVVSLRDIPGVKPANKHYPEAEYEFLIASCDPDAKWTVEEVEAGTAQVAMLSPIDQVVQFHGVTDRQARGVGEACMRAIAAGHSPDQDFRSYWDRVVPGTAAHFATGAHDEELT